MRFLKLLSLILTVALVTCLFSGCGSAKKDFKNAAEEFFVEFSAQKATAQNTQVLEFNKKAPYAINYLNIGNESVDKAVADYIDLKKTEFLTKAELEENKGNSLFVDFACYRAAENLIGVVVKTEQKTKDGALLSTDYKTFNFNLNSGKEITTELLSTKLRNKMSRHLNKYSEDKLGGEMIFDLNSKEISTAVLSENGLLVHINNFKNKVNIPYQDVARQISSDLRENLSITTINGQVIRDVDPTKPMVALTFDDGPSAKYTDKILDILEDYDSVATFFEVAANLKYAPDALRRAEQIGCEIGSHTTTHANLSKLDADGIRAELSKTNAEFERVLGHKPTLLRPPYGACNATVKQTCDQYLIGWSVDTLDWQSRNADKIINIVKSEKSLNGDVILMHSLYESTVQATEKLVPWLISEGYQLVTVSELIEYGYESDLTLGKYYSYNFFTGIE
ncbi:MAG: polysaccharide deacetylase family protein [Clostridia bacterium]|nr:polysaccharide deacetylase family protein [Clostridia bacterium]